MFGKNPQVTYELTSELVRDLHSAIDAKNSDLYYSLVYRLQNEPGLLDSFNTQFKPRREDIEALEPIPVSGISNFNLKCKTIPIGSLDLYLKGSEHLDEVEDLENLGRVISLSMQKAQSIRGNCPSMYRNLQSLYVYETKSLEGPTQAEFDEFLMSGAMSTVTNLYINCNGMNTSLLYTLCDSVHFTSLTRLELANSKVIGKYVADLARNSLLFKNLESLCIPYTDLEDDVLETLLREIPSTLKTLDLSGNMFTSKGVHHLRDAPCIENLEVLRLINSTLSIDELYALSEDGFMDDGKILLSSSEYHSLGIILGGSISKKFQTG